jgi:hypothetical protein
MMTIQFHVRIVGLGEEGEWGSDDEEGMEAAAAQEQVEQRHENHRSGMDASLVSQIFASEHILSQVYLIVQSLVSIPDAHLARSIGIPIYLYCRYT